MNVGDVALNVGVKMIRSEGLDRTERQARIWTLVISALVPVSVITLGTIVYVRRRHS